MPTNPEFIRRAALGLMLLAIIVALVAPPREHRPLPASSSAPPPFVEAASPTVVVPAPTMLPAWNPVATPTASAVPIPPPPPDVATLFASLPPATWRTFKEFAFNGERILFVRALQPSLIKDTITGGGPKVRPTDREFQNLYRWTGSGWEQIFDLYRDTSTVLGNIEFGPYVAGEPAAENSFLLGRLVIIPRVPVVGDMLALEVGAISGSSRMIFFNPTVALYMWDKGSLRKVWQEDFGVRGHMLGAVARGPGVEITVEASLRNEPPCCPTARLHILLQVDPEVVYLGSPRGPDVHELGRCLALADDDCLGRPLALRSSAP